jgi:hypothetical protein
MALAAMPMLMTDSVGSESCIPIVSLLIRLPLIRIAEAGTGIIPRSRS